MSNRNCFTLEHRLSRIALVEEFHQDFHAAAKAAMARGLYSVNTNLGDIEGALSRIWSRRHRYLKAAAHEKEKETSSLREVPGRVVRDDSKDGPLR